MANLLRGGDLGVTHGEDQVPFLQAAVPGGTRAVLRQAHHQRAVGEELDAHRLAQRDHRPRLRCGPDLLETEG